MLAILGLIPGVLSLIQFVTGKIFDAKVQITSARIGGDVEKAKAIVTLAQTEAHERTAWLSVVAGSTLLTFLIVAFALPLVIFEWQAIVWDKVFCPHFPTSYGFSCSTEAIRGQIADWANTIIVAIFGAPTTISLGKMILAKRNDKD